MYLRNERGDKSHKDNLNLNKDGNPERGGNKVRVTIANKWISEDLNEENIFTFYSFTS